ncbi:DUF3592 domain-containing protein [Amycolatopsis sp. NPDC021455]|uniref:DUF3592 domain-containing protein n=1 Tax=Amycolatopsis sp. NPDC021455 TaxID=3154901 RepID=UPI0034094056
MARDGSLPVLLRRRAAWQTVTAAAAIVCGFFSVSVPVYLYAHDPLSGDGVLSGLFAIWAVSAGLAVFGACELGFLARRIRTVVTEQDFAAWLPPADAADRDRRIDFAAETAGLRRLARRASALVLIWVALAGAGITGQVGLERAAADLLATGDRFDGVVLSVHERSRGTSRLEVGFGARTVWIVRTSPRRYATGDAVTVVVDPADPERVRTTLEPNDDQFLFNTTVVLLVAGFGGAPFAVVAALGWWRRARAVAATGWRVATVDVVPDRTRGRNRHLPDIHVRYRDGTGIVLRAARSLHRAKPMAIHTDRPAWIGGWGSGMVVLFPNGPHRPGPYAIPATARRARRERSQPISPLM